MRFFTVAMMAAAAMMASQVQAGRVPGMIPWKHYVPDETHFMSQEELGEVFQISCEDTLLNGDEFVPLTFVNGSCHDDEDPNEGLSGQAHRRMVPNTYIDGRSTPAQGLPNARLVSNRVVQQPLGLDLNIKDASRLLIFFGQFVDHDFALVLEQEEQEEAEENEEGFLEFPEFASEFIIVEIPEDDENEEFLEEGEMEFTRSRFCIDENFERQFVAVLTPYLDLGSVYGDTDNRSALVRQFSAGRMLINEELEDIGDFPPQNEDDLFLCGDIRCDENTQLFSWHTLWLRNHNYYADEYADARNFNAAQLQDPVIDDEIYNNARVRNIIEYQAVFWDQYMPYLLGRRTFDQIVNEVPYQFEEDRNPVTSLVFTTAVFRYGHSGVSNDLQFLDEEGEQVANTLLLSDAFFNAERAFDEIGERDLVGNLMLGQASLSHDILDSRVVEGIRDNLFRDLLFPGFPGFDLVTRNLERGRDHGIAYLNDYRVAAGLPPYTCPDNQRQCFRDLTGETEIADSLFELYEDFALCEMWVCGMAEKSFEDSLLGETFTILMAREFDNIRRSDRLWFENPIVRDSFTSLGGDDVLAPVEFPVTLNEVVDRNTGVNVDDDGNLFMIEPVWLAFTEDNRFQVEWFLSPENADMGITEYQIDISPDGGRRTQDADELLFYLFSNADSGTRYTVTVTGRTSDGESVTIGETNFRTTGDRDDSVIAGLSAGAVAGIAVGVGVVVIGAVGAFFMTRKNTYNEFNNETFL